jgi:hypothetical protein
MTTARREEVFVQLICGRARGRPEPVRPTNRDECTCDRKAVAYTRSV